MTCCPTVAEAAIILGVSYLQGMKSQPARQQLIFAPSVNFPQCSVYFSCILRVLTKHLIVQLIKIVFLR
jgi:hypothetical protein